MLRRYFLTLLMALMMTLITGAQPTESTFTLLLYDHETGTLSLQSNSPTVEAGRLINLPLPQSFTEAISYSRGVGITADGERVAYSVLGTDEAGGQGYALMVYDITQDAILLQYTPAALPLDDTLFFSGDRPIFNESGSAVALGTITAANDAPQGWSIVVLDVASNRVLFELGNDTAAMRAQLPQPPAPFLLPVVQRYQGAQVSFTLVPWGTEAGSVNPNFRWDVLIGRVTTATAYPSPQSRTLLTTNEVLSPVFDTRFPLSDQPTRLQNNAVHIYTPQIDGRFPFITDANLDFIGAWFIEGGRRVLLRTGDLTTEAGGVRWWLAQRSGTRQAFPAISPAENVIAMLEDGFAYTEVSDDDSAELVTVVNVGDRYTETRFSLPHKGVPIWSAAPVDTAQLAAWGELAEPIFPEIVQAAPPTPTVSAQVVSPSELAQATPIGTGVLTVNGVAIINTTQGDRLNMRETAGLAGAIIARIEPGTRVTLLEGPRAVDGFVWWRVRLATGLDGWVVQSADGISTLIPQN